MGREDGVLDPLSVLPLLSFLLLAVPPWLGDQYQLLPNSHFVAVVARSGAESAQGARLVAHVAQLVDLGWLAAVLAVLLLAAPVVAVALVGLDSGPSPWQLPAPEHVEGALAEVGASVLLVQLGLAAGVGFVPLSLVAGRSTVVGHPA